MMWQTYLRPTSLEEALELLHQFAGQARLVAGGTDVIVELQRGVKPTTTLIDITGLQDLKYVRFDGNTLALGALTTHTMWQPPKSVYSMPCRWPRHAGRSVLLRFALVQPLPGISLL